MKTHKNVFEKIYSVKNLIRAFKEASGGKRYKKSVLVFKENLVENIKKIREELKNKSYKHGEYLFFSVRDPKERKISAAPFRDRVIHHAIYQVINPIFDKKFIFDSFANRNKKGTHNAVKRLQQFLRKIQRERERVLSNIKSGIG